MTFGQAVNEAAGKALTRVKAQGRQSAPAGDDAEARAVREKTLRWNALTRQIGSRYARCRISNFRLSNDPGVKAQQEAVTAALRAYGEKIGENVKAGRGIVLDGQPGTGKDHLLVGLMFAAIGAGLSVEWRNGMDLFGQLRDAITNGTEERRVLAELVKPDVLVLSDPVPPWGDLTQFQGSFLFRLVDARYRNLRPVWVTTNSPGEDDAEKRMGVQVVDRLCDGALCLGCSWPSYRGPGELQVTP